MISTNASHYSTKLHFGNVYRSLNNAIGYSDSVRCHISKSLGPFRSSPFLVDTWMKTRSKSLEALYVFTMS